jgi:hypothetical protein
MNDRQNLQIAAYERSLALLNNNLPIIQSSAVIMDTKSALEQSINEIRIINVEEEKGTGGAFGDFTDAKNQLTNITIAVQGSLIALAIAENNNEILDAANFGMTEFRRTSQEAFYDKCKVIYNLALPQKVKLTTTYLLPETALASLNTALEKYRLALPDKGLAKKNKTANTKKRNQAFEQTAGIMTKLGLLMLMYRATHPEFYESYLAAAHIGGNPTKKTKNHTLVNGQAVDFETHEAIANAKISVVLQQSETYSGADGNFSLAVPTPGEITIKAEKAGYTLWEDDIIIEAGENITMLVEMEKEE